MSWSDVADASTNWAVSESSSASFSTQANVSHTWALANVNGYVDVDYVYDDYIDDNTFAGAGAAANTWVAA
jgi:hypothetical protein